MKLAGRLIVGTKVRQAAFFENKDKSKSFRELLEECLIGLCKELEISVPIWLKKNTKEFAHFKGTFFTKEQFSEAVDFDRFEIKLE